jgi:DNA helicase-2/ATP-dependent DNA helicase PcrA
VGDDDQSIYRFRGATIENILNFEHEYKDAQVIRLEQNYRSTQIILDAANAVIANNRGRKGKSLWTAKEGGDRITWYSANDEQGEARFIADTIAENITNGRLAGDHAVLYRMNAQSNAIENVLMRSGISYRVIGGMKFFDRKEIRDVIAYLSLINNPNDGIALKRIVNEPKRGIGDTTVNNVASISEQTGIGMLEIMATANQYQALSRASGKLIEFAAMIKDFINKVNEYCTDIYKDIMNLDEFNIKYRPSIEIDLKNSNLKEYLKEEYNKKLDYDIKLCSTSIGPHKDDIEFYLGEKNLKFYGSQGQQRVAVLALKLSEIEIFKKYKESTPILLLDDIFSELDDIKKNNLLKYINKNIQTIITTTDLNNLDDKLIKKSKLFNIKNGNIIKIKEVKLDEQ